MWVFYLISLPLTLGMVIVTLMYFAGPWVPRYVFLTVGYTWFCSLSVIILVPADIWMTISHNQETGVISFFWSWSYWSTFLLTWAVVPLIQGFEDAGDFTVKERLKTSIHVNLVFYLVVGSIGLFGLILLIMMHKIWMGGILGFAMACSNTFGLVTGAFLLGFGLSEIPKSIWRNADWTIRQKVLSHKISKMAVKLDDAHQELSNAIVVAQATSKQMSKRDPLRPYMNVIDNMLTQMFREDPSFKPQGGRLGENDMDYDTDEKSMATLRRHLRRAREEYYRYKSQYMAYVMKALELEDTIKNYERRRNWKYVSTHRPARSGKLGSIFDTIEFMWRCILRKHLEKVLAVILGIMSAAILLAEATLLPSVDLSLFSMLIKLVGREEVLVQHPYLITSYNYNLPVLTPKYIREQPLLFVPLMYMCVCTYYSLFKFGTLMFYSLTPRQTSSVNLLLICSMVARYAPPVSFNFLNLIRLGGNVETVFEKRMGKIDDAVPFFGKDFNRIYPLIMVIYTLLVASNFFNRVIDFLGSWKRFRFQSEVDDMNGFDPSGVIILEKERSWLEQGRMVGEHVIPLARNFNSIDLESGSNSKDLVDVKTKATNSVINEDMNGKSSKSSSTDDGRKYGSSREAMSNKYAVIREQIRQSSLNTKPVANIASAQVNLLDSVEGESSNTNDRTSSVLASKWESMKMGFQNLKANIGTKKFLPMQQTPETKTLSRLDSSQSLDEIFQRLKRPSDHGGYSDEEDGTEIKSFKDGIGLERLRTR